MIHVPTDDAGRAVVQTAIAPMHAEARISSAQISQRLRGAPLEVLERAGDGGEWLRVRGDDGYAGWVHGGYLLAMDGARAVEAFTHLSLGCTVRTRGGRRLALPLGARLAADESIVEGRAIPLAEAAREFPAGAAAIAETARRHFEGAPYQWGGVTPWGADCSGLVQSCFALHGVALPRDAWQQAAADAGGSAATVLGGALEGRAAELRAADLLFFSDRPDRRITHVGIALGDARMAHAALGRGGFAIESLDGREDGYVAALLERFLFARRLSPGAAADAEVRRGERG